MLSYQLQDKICAIMCRLLPIVVLLVSLVALSSDAEVVSSLTTCKSSFYKGQIPKNIATNNHVRICQLLNNKYHYATLFDKEKRVPVYSAYVFKSGNNSERPLWYYEPQVRRCLFYYPLLEMHIPDSKDLAEGGVHSYILLSLGFRMHLSRGQLLQL